MHDAPGLTPAMTEEVKLVTSQHKKSLTSIEKYCTRFSLVNRFLAIICGGFMLRGHNWASLALAWIVPRALVQTQANGKIG